MALPVARFAAAVRARNPLIHSITNYVVAPFQANALSALGASPIMADEPEEAAKLTGLSDGLVVNIGTLNQHSINAMYLGDSTATQINLPSDGSQRSVSTYIMLVTDQKATGTASRLALYPLNTEMLLGAQKSFTLKAADDNGYAASLAQHVNLGVTGGIGTIAADGTIAEVRMTSQGAGQPYAPGEKIPAYQACEVGSGAYIDGGTTESQPPFVQLCAGGSAVFRYFRCESPCSKARLRCSGKGKAALLAGEKTVCLFDVQSAGSTEAAAELPAGQWELTLHALDGGFLQVSDLVLE